MLLNFNIKDKYISLFSKISSYSNLEKGWDFGLGDPASKSVIDSACSLLEYLLGLGFIDIDCSLGSEGEIALCCKYDNFFVDVICESDNTYSLIIHSNENVTLHLSRYNIADVKKSIEENALWSAPTSFILINLSNLKKDLHKPPSKTTVGHSQSLGATVLLTQVNQCVIISNNIMENSPLLLEPQLCSGNLTQTYYLQSA